MWISWLNLGNGLLLLLAVLVCVLVVLALRVSIDTSDPVAGERSPFGPVSEFPQLAEGDRPLPEAAAQDHLPSADIRVQDVMVLPRNGERPGVWGTLMLDDVEVPDFPYILCGESLVIESSLTPASLATAVLADGTVYHLLPIWDEGTDQSQSNDC